MSGEIRGRISEKIIPEETLGEISSRMPAEISGSESLDKYLKKIQGDSWRNF